MGTMSKTIASLLLLLTLSLASCTSCYTPWSSQTEEIECHARQSVRESAAVLRAKAEECAKLDPTMRAQIGDCRD